VEKLPQTVGAVYDVKSIEAYVILMTDESQRVRYDTAPVNTVGAVARRWKMGGKNYRTGSDGRYFSLSTFRFDFCAF
jgi:cell shape-determining protein MreC